MTEQYISEMQAYQMTKAVMHGDEAGYNKVVSELPGRMSFDDAKAFVAEIMARNAMERAGHDRTA